MQYLRVCRDVLQSEVRGEVDDLQAWQGRTKVNVQKFGVITLGFARATHAQRALRGFTS